MSTLVQQYQIPRNLSELTNMELAQLRDAIFIVIGERSHWLKVIAPEIKRSRVRDDGPIALRTLQRQQRTYREQLKEAYVIIEFIEADMDRRVKAH